MGEETMEFLGMVLPASTFWMWVGIGVAAIVVLIVVLILVGFIKEMKKK